MSRRYSIAEARNHLPRLVHEVEKGEEVELTRRGEAVAVLLSRPRWERLSARRKGFWTAYREFAAEVDFGSLGISPDEVFSDTRDRSTGRIVVF